MVSRATTTVWVTVGSGVCSDPGGETPEDWPVSGSARAGMERDDSDVLVPPSWFDLWDVLGANPENDGEDLINVTYCG